MNNTRLALLLLAAALALSACGNKGPLVLPDKPEDSSVPAEGTTPAGATPTETTPPATTPAEDVQPTPPELPQEEDN